MPASQFKQVGPLLGEICWMPTRQYQVWLCWEPIAHLLSAWHVFARGDVKINTIGMCYSYRGWKWGEKGEHHLKGQGLFAHISRNLLLSGIVGRNIGILEGLVWPWEMKKPIILGHRRPCTDIREQLSRTASWLELSSLVRNPCTVFQKHVVTAGLQEGL